MDGQPPPPGRDADLLIVDGDIVTMSGTSDILYGGAIAIRGQNIADVGTTAELRQRYPGTPELDATDCVVTPGMINAHQHTSGDPLIRSVIPDHVPDADAIGTWIDAIHAHTLPEDDLLSAALVAAESLLRGVTTVLDPGTVAHPLHIAEGLRRVGIRGRVGSWGTDSPQSRWARPYEDVLQQQEATVRRLDGDPRVTGWITLVGHDWVSDDLFCGAAELASRLDTLFTFHMSPGPQDAQLFAERTGHRPLTHLSNIGALTDRALVAHAVWIDDAEMTCLLTAGARVASCPAAYLRLRQGYSRAGRHAEFLSRGGKLALGCDSHNAADTPDVLRAAWLLAAIEGDRDPAQAIPAATAFALATSAGAAAVGLGDSVGAIEPGKRADIVVYDGRDIAWTPKGDLATHLIWGSPSHTVRDVLVDGEPVVRDHELQRVDLPELRAQARARSHALRRRAGIGPRR